SPPARSSAAAEAGGPPHRAGRGGPAPRRRAPPCAAPSGLLEQRVFGELGMRFGPRFCLERLPLAALRLVHAVEREVETGARLHRACSRLVGLGFGLQEEIRRLQRRQTAAAGAVLLPFGHLLRRSRGRQLLLRFRRETLRGGPQTRDASLF